MREINQTTSVAPVQFAAPAQPPARVERDETSCLGDVARATAKFAAGTFAVMAAGVAFEAFKAASPGSGMAAVVLGTAAGLFQLTSYIGVPVSGYLE